MNARPPPAGLMGHRKPPPSAAISFDFEIDGQQLIMSANQMRIYVGPWTPEGLTAAGQAMTQLLTRTVQSLTRSGSTGDS